ncbi:MAG: hypothetical protein WCK74_03845 [Gemmatimonadaceae bacterium]|jgi:predicted ribonuclease YlaK
MAASRSTVMESHPDDAASTMTGPLACADALGRTAAETCRQHERLSKLTELGVAAAELAAAVAMVDTIDLALAEAVQEFERVCDTVPVSDQVETRQKANALWLAAREYLRRHSIAERAAEQLSQHDAEELGVLKFEYELEASALLALRQATTAFMKQREQR